MTPGTAKPAATNTINGHADTRGDNDTRFEHFYAKLSRLEDDIVSGKHPYYKLPEAALQQLVSRSRPENSDPARRFHPSSSSSSSSFPNSLSTSAPASTFPSIQVRADTSRETDPQKTDAVVRNGEVSSKSQFFAQSGNEKAALDTKATKVLEAEDRDAPQIASVLLTKSADLVKAEFHLKRQKIERVLREQLEQKQRRAQAQAQERDSGVDFVPELDVNRLLAEALAIVKHVSGLRPRANSNSSVSSSVDDQSFYSSRDNGSVSERQSAAKLKGKRLAQGSGLVKDGQQNMIEQEDQNSVKESIEQPKAPEPNNVAIESSKKSHTAQGNSPTSMLHTNKVLNPPAQAYEAREESEYSPPAPEQFDNSASANGILHVRKHSRNFSNVTRRSSGKQLIRDGDTTDIVQKVQSPVVPVIRNHIEQPLAPQPARVSPLAVTKMPRIAQNKPNQLGHGYSADYTASQVPSNVIPADSEMRAGPSRTYAEYSGYHSQHNQTADRPQSRSSRKRPRDFEEPEIQQVSTVTKRIARSPMYAVEPIVKEEPLSPAPLTASRPARRIIREYPADLEYLPRREPALGSAYYAESPYSRPAYRYEYEEPTSPGYIHPQPRVVYQRVARENSDIRRTVSLQHVRRRSSPVAYVQPYPHGQGPATRVSSPYYLDRPHPQDEPYTTRMYARPMVSRSPPPYVGVQGPREPIHSEMPPPSTRRVVYGQYRERYEEVPPPERRQSVGPLIRRAEVDPYYDPAMPPPSQEYRARRPILPPEINEDETYSQRLQARPTSRRYQDVPASEREYVEWRDPYQRTYSMRPVEDVRAWHDYGHYPEASPRYVENAGRRLQPPPRYEELVPARGYEARPYSAHPERSAHAGTVDGATSASSHLVSAVPPEAPAPPLRPLPQEYYRHPSASVPPQAAARDYARPAEAPLSNASHYYERVQEPDARSGVPTGARTEAGAPVTGNEEYMPIQHQQHHQHHQQRERPPQPLPPAVPAQTRSYSYAEPYHPHGQTRGLSHSQVQAQGQGQNQSQAPSQSQYQIQRQNQGQGYGQQHKRYVGDDEPYDPTSPMLATGPPQHDRYLAAAVAVSAAAPTSASAPAPAGAGAGAAVAAPGARTTTYRY